MMEFMFVFLLAYGFFWYAGKVIDDVLQAADEDYAAWRARKERRNLRR
jgi:hypothetical protein